jgi:hypothetical protein
VSTRKIVNSFAPFVPDESTRCDPLFLFKDGGGGPGQSEEHTRALNQIILEINLYQRSNGGENPVAIIVPESTAELLRDDPAIGYRCEDGEPMEVCGVAVLASVGCEKIAVAREIFWKQM